MRCSALELEAEISSLEEASLIGEESLVGTGFRERRGREECPAETIREGGLTA